MPFASRVDFLVRSSQETDLLHTDACCTGVLAVLMYSYALVGVSAFGGLLFEGSTSDAIDARTIRRYRGAGYR